MLVHQSGLSVNRSDKYSLGKDWSLSIIKVHTHKYLQIYLYFLFSTRNGKSFRIFHKPDHGRRTRKCLFSYHPSRRCGKNAGRPGILCATLCVDLNRCKNSLRSCDGNYIILLVWRNISTRCYHIAVRQSQPKFRHFSGSRVFRNLCQFSSSAINSPLFWFILYLRCLCIQAKDHFKVKAILRLFSKTLKQIQKIVSSFNFLASKIVRSFSHHSLSYFSYNLSSEKLISYQSTCPI